MDPGILGLPESSCHFENDYHIVLRPNRWNIGEREKRLSTPYLELLIVLDFLVILVSGSYALVVLMPHLLRYSIANTIVFTA
jgi:hypothetical protein